MSDIGKAYVQIIPKAEGISGQIEDIVSPAAEQSGKKGGAFLGKSLLKGLAAAGIAAGVAKLFSSAINEGANLQQSFGGLDTLYGDAAAAAKEYAYQAAEMGISANDYAEQAVSFGASLKQAFGGNTAKAAEAANTAISDMADNAAKMGTPLESIQNAYQGFAKGNYTMLDNLKLGFGGTKEEMQRLLETAENSPKNVLGKSFDIDNLGDVYEAIHIIQEDLGLTGVAADEASTTFSGSLGAMRAAAQNVMANLALGENIWPSLMSLETAIKNFLVKNALPLIGNIIKSIPALLVEIPAFLAELIPEIVPVIGQMISDFGNAVIDGIPMFIASMGQLFDSIWATVSNIDWMSVANNLLTGLSTAIGSIWDSVTELLRVEFGIDLPDFETVKQNISDLWDQVKEGIGEFFQASFDILMDDDMTIIEKISALWDLVKAGIGDFFKAAFDITLPAAQDAIAAIDDWWSINVWPSIQNFFKTTFGVEIPSWEDVKEAVSAFWEDFKTGIAEFFKTTFNVELPTWSDVQADIKAGWAEVKRGIGSIFSWVFDLKFPDIDTIVQDLKEWWGKVAKGVGDFFTLKWLFDDGSSAEEASKLIIDEHGGYSSGSKVNIGSDKVNVDSQAIQDALNSANLTLADVDTSSIDAAKQAVVDAVAQMERAIAGAKLVLPTVESSAMQAASQVIASWVSTFKRQLKFSWTLPTPHGYLPNISVTMREATSSDGSTKANYPVFSKSLQWFAKGGIFDAPSVIGVGESGAEAVVPLDKMWNRMSKEFDKHLGGNKTVNNYFTVNGSQDPEAWAMETARTLKRELRMA